MSFLKKVFQFFTAPTKPEPVSKKQESKDNDTIVIPVEKTDSHYSQIMKEIKSYNNKHDPQKKIIETLSLLTVEIMGLKRDMVSYQNILKNQNVVLAELVKETTRLSDNMDALLSSIAEDYDNLEDMSKYDKIVQDDSDENETNNDDDVKQVGNPNKKRKFGLN
jgi:hypothetical protein